MTLRIIFMGTPDFAVPTLTEIVGQGHEVVAVYTQPPRPAGRGMAERPSPVHALAERLGIPVLTPKSLRSAEEQDRFAALGADAAVVVAYGLILPQAVLDAPRLGAFNLHGSLLPRWRGAAPIQRAVMAGDAETGVMVMRMEAGLDTGPVATAERITITADMTAGQLHDRMAPLGADLMVRALGAVERGSLTLTPQAAEGVTYAAKIDKAETRIDWSRPAAAVHNHIRGLSPFPGAWTEIAIGGKAERVKVLRSVVVGGSGRPGIVLDDKLTVATGAGAVRLLEVQRAGGKVVSADAFLRGTSITKGSMLDSHLDWGKFRNVRRPRSVDAIYRCPCCHYQTLHERGGDEICQVCFWHDDGQDDHDADEVRGGPNRRLSLTQARRNFAEFGASDLGLRALVRPPTPSEF